MTVKEVTKGGGFQDSRKRLVKAVSDSNQVELNSALADFEKYLVTDEMRKRELPLLERVEKEKVVILNRERRVSDCIWHFLMIRYFIFPQI